MNILLSHVIPSQLLLVFLHLLRKKPKLTKLLLAVLNVFTSECLFSFFFCLIRDRHALKSIIIFLASFPSVTPVGFTCLT